MCSRIMIARAEIEYVLVNCNCYANRNGFAILADLCKSSHTDLSFYYCATEVG